LLFSGSRITGLVVDSEAETRKLIERREIFHV